MAAEVDLVCERVLDGVLHCVYQQPDSPFWVYPVVIAVFIMAILILLLVARLTFGGPRTKRERREDIDAI